VEEFQVLGQNFDESPVKYPVADGSQGGLIIISTKISFVYED
jgi:hypothetical protein